MLLYRSRIPNLDDPARLGVLINPRARFNQNYEVISGPDAARAGVPVVRTEEPAQLRRALRHLIAEEKVSVLAICGGDGTIHYTINELVEYWLRERAQAGSTVPLPTILLLRGGTMNMVARAVRVEGDPRAILRRFLRYHGGARLRDLPTVEVGMLSVRSDVMPRRHGFIFGSSLVATCMEFYRDLFGGGYLGLARFLSNAMWAQAFKTGRWREYSHLLKAADSPVMVDGKLVDPYLVTVATTVDMKLFAGLVHTVPGCERPGVFSTRVIRETDKHRVIQSVPRLFMGAEVDGVADFPETRELELRGGYTLDGEVYRYRSTDRTADEKLRVTATPFRLRIVAPFP